MYVLGKQDCFEQYTSSRPSKKFAERKKLIERALSLLGDFARFFKLRQVRIFHMNNTRVQTG